LSEVVEGFLKVRDEAVALSGFYHDVIDVNLKVMPYFLFEGKLHTSLICSPRVLQSKRKFHIAKTTKRSNERGGRLIHLGEGYLVIA
jgi:hypothetical protein